MVVSPQFPLPTFMNQREGGESEIWRGEGRDGKKEEIVWTQVVIAMSIMFVGAQVNVPRMIQHRDVKRPEVCRRSAYGINTIPIATNHPLQNIQNTTTNSG